MHLQIMRINIENIESYNGKIQFRLSAINENRSFNGLLTIALKDLYAYAGTVEGEAFDLLLLASTVYGIDILVKREYIASDKWSRDLEFTFPVADPDKWGNVHDKVNQLLHFLTADYWNIDFVKREQELNIPVYEIKNISVDSYKKVCLFSGGMDSLIGAIDLLHDNKDKILFISHYDSIFKGAKADQDKIIPILKENFPESFDHIQTRIDIKGSSRETTLRSRSFMFLSQAIYAASNLAPNIEIILPENGTIALNHPLTASRYSTCSTRTAHPYVIKELNEIAQMLGLPNNIMNPYEFKTKGEMVEECVDRELFKITSPLSCSCAKRGTRKDIRENPHAINCGICMPCIYRRAALHKIGLDTEDIGTNALNPNDLIRDLMHIPDMPAFLDFLAHDLSKKEIEANLLCNGSLPLDELSNYADVVVRVREELKQWIEDKGNEEIKHRIHI